MVMFRRSSLLITSILSALLTGCPCTPSDPGTPICNVHGCDVDSDCPPDTWCSVRGCADPQEPACMLEQQCVNRLLPGSPCERNAQCCADLCEQGKCAEQTGQGSCGG